ncbi:MAG: dephospho-CoA kinase [Chloroflexi bacterium]|nr:dephospho-CoA kinase [Chloroflexota bacterium]
MRVIGLTGGIGTGKSEAAAALAELGAEVIDADAEGHLAYRSGTPGWERVVELFGRDILGPDGEVDRSKLGSIVFGDPAALASLNEVVHPLIRERIEARLAELAASGTGVAVVDAALLYQAGWDELTDEVWVVTAPQDAVAERLVARRGMSGQTLRRRIEAQGPAETLASRAAVTIHNAGSLRELRDRVGRLWHQILKEGSASHDKQD